MANATNTLLNQYGAPVQISLAPPITSTAITTVGAGTLTAASLIGGIVNRTGSTSAFTDTTDTAAALYTALAPNNNTNQSFLFTYFNGTKAVATIAAGTGVTLSGITVVGVGQWAEFLVVQTSSTAVTMTGIACGPINSTSIPTLFTAVSGNTPATLTGAQVAGAGDVTVNMTATLAGAGTLNTPTGANWLAAIPNATVGQTYRLRIVNSSSGNFAWTVTAGDANVTVNGTATIAQNTFRDFYVTVATATTVTIQSIGVGAGIL